MEKKIMRRRISKKGVKWIALWIATVLSEREYLNGVSSRQKKNLRLTCKSWVGVKQNTKTTVKMAWHG